MRSFDLFNSHLRNQVPILGIDVERDKSQIINPGLKREQLIKFAFTFSVPP